MSIEIILLLIAVAFILIIIAMYNGLINRRNQVENVFGSIDALLKKRYDLIPNLVSSVQEYMKHEQGTLTKITELRTKALSGDISSDEKVEINNEMSKVLGGIKLAFENYPDLKASQNFIQMQSALNEVEEQISAARRAYNAAVTDYNNGVEMFPSSVIASFMKFKRKHVLETPEAERKNVNVKDLFNK